MSSLVFMCCCHCNAPLEQQSEQKRRGWPRDCEGAIVVVLRPSKAGRGSTNVEDGPGDVSTSIPVTDDCDKLGFAGTVVKEDLDSTMHTRTRSSACHACHGMCVVRKMLLCLSLPLARQRGGRVGTQAPKRAKNTEMARGTTTNRSTTSPPAS